MGNVGSNSSSGRNRRRRNRRSNETPATSQPGNPTTVRHVEAPSVQQYYHQYPAPLSAPYDHHHYRGVAGHVAGQGGGHVAPMPYVEHEKAVTIRNDVNVKRESLSIDADVDNPGMFLVSFTFDATVSGCITIMFFVKEGDECELEQTKSDQVSEPITVSFEQGLGQRFVQRSGTGFNPSTFEDAEVAGKEDKDAEKVYHLAVKAGTETNSQVTLAIFERERCGSDGRGGIRARVWKQILWVKGMRYELQEIYGIANSDVVNDPDKDCVICLSEPRDTTVLPCRHMCLCNGCAKVLRFQTNRCPICRKPVERLLEIRLTNNNE